MKRKPVRKRSKTRSIPRPNPSATRSGKRLGTKRGKHTKRKLTRSRGAGSGGSGTSGAKHIKDEYDFCLAKDRLRWYKKMRQDYKAQVQKREPEESSAIRVDIDIGERTNKKRRATLFVGHRRFIHLGRLRKFLLLTKGYDGDKAGIDWSRKSGMCQFPKYARIVLVPVHPRGKLKILHSYRLKQPL